MLPLLDKSKVIEWHRVQAYQDISLKLILQEVLQDLARERGNDHVYLRREIVREPLRPLPVLPEDGFHLYTSNHNAGISSFTTLLEVYQTAQAMGNLKRSQRRSRGSSSRSFIGSRRTQGESLRITNDPSQMHQALHFLCYLNADTHTSGETTARLHEELERALRAGMHILLVHETRLEANGVPFKTIIDATPDGLQWNSALHEKRLYKELAVMICGSVDEEHRDHLNVGLHLLLNAVATIPAPTPEIQDEDVFEAQLAVNDVQAEISGPAEEAEGRGEAPADCCASDSSTVESIPQPPSRLMASLTSASKLACPTAEPARRMTLMQDHRRGSSLSCTKERPGRINSSRDLLQRSSSQASELNPAKSAPVPSTDLEPTEPPGAPRCESTSTSSPSQGSRTEVMASHPHRLRRSSSREEALTRKMSVSATSRPEQLLRACARVPVKAARVVQSGVDTVCNSVSQNINPMPAVQSVRHAFFGLPEAAQSAAPSQARSLAGGTGWKSGRLREAIRGGTLAAAAEGGSVEINNLKAMVDELQAQLREKKIALAAANTKVTGLQTSGAAGGAMPRQDRECADVATSSNGDAARSQCQRRRSSASLPLPGRGPRKRPDHLPKPSALPRPSDDALSLQGLDEIVPQSPRPTDQCNMLLDSQLATPSPQLRSTPAQHGALPRARKKSITAVDARRQSHVEAIADRSAPPTVQRRLQHNEPVALSPNNELPQPSVPPPPTSHGTTAGQLRRPSAAVCADTRAAPSLEQSVIPAQRGTRVLSEGKPPRSGRSHDERGCGHGGAQQRAIYL